jgi:hypothetical protein
MPIKSDDMPASDYLRLLVLGPPKVGKSTTCIATAPGPVYVINSDDPTALRAARDFKTPSHPNGQTFVYDNAFGDNHTAIEACIREAQRGVKAGEYNSIVWDTISVYAERVLDVFEDASRGKGGDSDGRRFWPAHRKHIRQIIDRLSMLRAHLIVTSHYLDVHGPVIDGQLDKQGDGIAPNLPGQLRQSVPAMFSDVVYLDKKGDQRFFITRSGGAFGPGGRTLPGTRVVEGDVSKLWEMMRTSGASQVTK